MRTLAALVLALALSAPAYAQTADTPKPAPEAKAPVHKPAKPAKKRRNDGTDEPAAAQCRDVRTHRFTKCGGPYAEPVPAE